MLKKIIKFVLILCCMILIFCFSSDNSVQSTRKSDSVIVKISETVLGRKLTRIEKDKYIDKFVFVVRKGAHFTIYFILGFLLISFIKEFRVVDYKSFLLAIFIACLYATSDEIHQLFVAGRSGEIRDVLLDTAGAIVGCLVYLGFYKLRRKIYE